MSSSSDYKMGMSQQDSSKGRVGTRRVGAVAAPCSEGFAETFFLFYNLSEKKPDSIPEGAK